MNMPQMPPSYIKRENSEASFGRNPKTVFRHIKKAIEQGGEKHKALLEHCCLQLLDGEIVAGTDVTSMTQIDEYRQQGRVPSWYIDADFFASYFNALRTPASNPDQKAPPTDSASTGTTKAEISEVVDPAIIKQYELRLAEKDDQIRELRIDKNDLRQQLQANTNLTERITGLLSHSQLAALGVPESMVSSKSGHPATAPKVVEAEVSDDTPTDSQTHATHVAPKEGSQRSKTTKRATSEQSPQSASKQRTASRPKEASAKPHGTNPKKNVVTKKRSSGKGAAAKRQSFWKRDVRDLLFHR